MIHRLDKNIVQIYDEKENLIELSERQVLDNINKLKQINEVIDDYFESSIIKEIKIKSILEE